MSTAGLAPRAKPTRLDRGLAACETLLARHLQAAVRRFGSAALGVIDLPPLAAGTVDAEAVRVAAVLLWAREVEAAGLPAVVEAVAEAFSRGQLDLAAGPAGQKLLEYHRNREERFTLAERESAYERLFGAPADPAHPVSRLITELMGLLAEIGRSAPERSLSGLAARLRVVGLELGEELSSRASGMSAFLARDVSEHIRTAWELVQDPDVIAALGGGTPWSVVRALGPGLLGHPVDPGPHLSRARSGQRVLAWLADHAEALGTGGLSVAAGDPVVEWALTWEAQGPA